MQEEPKTLPNKEEIDMLSIKQVMEALQVTRMTVLNRMRKGEFRGINIAPTGSKRPVWRIPKQDIMALYTRKNEKTSFNNFPKKES